MDTILKYEWQQAVLDAFLELEPERLSEKLGVAERTITERLRNPQPDERERVALSDALHLLLVIFPNWRAANSRTAVGSSSPNSPRASITGTVKLRKALPLASP